MKSRVSSGSEDGYMPSENTHRTVDGADMHNGENDGKGMVFGVAGT